jgi:hypothetical protein
VGSFFEQKLAGWIVGALLALMCVSTLQIKSGNSKVALGSTSSLAANKQTENTNSLANRKTLIEPGLYRVDFPENFSFPPEKILLQLSSDISAPYYRYQSNDNISTYEISYLRFPDSAFQSKSLKQILDDLTDGELGRFQGVLKKESTVNESSNLVKREIEIQANQNDLFVRTYLILNRPYVYLVCYTSKNKNNLYSAKTQSFFDSFKLYEQAAPQTIVMSANSNKAYETTIQQPNSSSLSYQSGLGSGR